MKYFVSSFLLGLMSIAYADPYLSEEQLSMKIASQCAALEGKDKEVCSCIVKGEIESISADKGLMKRIKETQKMQREKREVSLATLAALENELMEINHKATEACAVQVYGSEPNSWRLK